MKLTVRVKPNSRSTIVDGLDDGSYRVAVAVPPEKGRANAAVISALAEHFRVPKSSVAILAGHTARTKIVEIVGVSQT